MANTWNPALESGLNARIPASGWNYQVFNQNGKFTYSIQTANTGVTLPVEVVMGGERHGLGFLAKIDRIADLPLARPALVQARYFWSFKQGALVEAPGLPEHQPHSFESALGLVLSPAFEKRCLACHGEPQRGVRCESCHGPGSQHVAGRAILNESTAICAQCHAGFGRHIDPEPDDLLIANQVQALQTSECFIQTRGAFSCTACHNPHKDAGGDDSAAIRTCLNCHSVSMARHAAICPVNANSGCIGCHMPSVNVGPLRLVDHQIRGHPEQNVTARSAALPSTITPVREFLRIIRTTQREKILEAQRELKSGKSFYDVARAFSDDETAAIGGYWGEKNVADLDPALAKLDYGELSGIVQAGGQYYLVQRLPRDFKWQAAQLQREAEALHSIEKSQEALRIYPHYLRALRFIGTTLAQNGNPQRAAAVLSLTNRLYPDDAVTLFALGVVLGQLHQPREEIDTYRRVLKLEPDFVAAYSRLGIALDAVGDYTASVDILRQGLQIDPLSAELYRDLSISLAHQGKSAEAKQSAALAARLRLQ
ncbi:MAG TPA: peptidylprolyl isomerase [Bryobacteraceae bacterium]|nr:peptidylprolyl isomerase [Bryobacteraceae bacterium]